MQSPALIIVACHVPVWTWIPGMKKQVPSPHWAKGASPPPQMPPHPPIHQHREHVALSIYKDTHSHVLILKWPKFLFFLILRWTEFLPEENLIWLSLPLCLFFCLSNSTHSSFHCDRIFLFEQNQLRSDLRMSGLDWCHFFFFFWGEVLLPWIYHLHVVYL